MMASMRPIDLEREGGREGVRYERKKGGEKVEKER